MKHAIGLHCQFMTDDGALWDKMIKSGKPFSVFVVPELLVDNLLTDKEIKVYENVHSAENHYPDWAKERFADAKNNPDITFVQEGYLHCCQKDFLKAKENERNRRGFQPDPFHEHICVSDGTAQDSEKQKKVIKLGREIIRKKLGIEKVINYCAPNHLWDKNTLKVLDALGYERNIARNGFDYFTGGLISLLAYFMGNEEDGLTVIPESMVGEGKKSPLIGVYYNRLGSGGQSKEEFLRFFNSAVPLSEIEVEGKNFMHDVSEYLVCKYKKARDLKTMAKARVKSLINSNVFFFDG